MNKIIQGDCLEVMDNLIEQNVKVDAIITDPPYEFKKGGFGGGKGELAKRDLKADIVGGGLHVGFNIENVFSKFSKLQNKCNVCIFCAEAQMVDICNYAREKDYYYTVLVWHKTNPTPLCNNRYLGSIEFIVHIREKGVKILGDYHSKDKVYTSSINKKDKKLLKNHTEENQTVLDPFAGSGSTGVACQNTNRNFILIEKEEKYIKIIEERLNIKCEEHEESNCVPCSTQPSEKLIEEMTKGLLDVCNACRGKIKVGYCEDCLKEYK